VYAKIYTRVENMNKIEEGIFATHEAIDTQPAGGNSYYKMANDAPCVITKVD
jgi:hypothetical protein